MGRQLRHPISVFICTCVAFLLLSEVGLCLKNIALNKTAQQSTITTWIPTSGAFSAFRAFRAFRAVDGIPEYCSPEYYNNGVADDWEYSHTGEGRDYPRQWWKVDLGSVYYIYRIALCNRGQHNFRLSQIYILSSNSPLDMPPAPNRAVGTEWVEQSYHPGAYGNYTDVTFKEDIANFQARHVSVYNNGNLGVTLREVEINGFSRADINKVETRISNHTSSQTISINLTMNGFDSEIFESVSLTIKKRKYKWSQTYDEVHEREIYANGEYTYKDSNLQPSTLYSYRVKLTSHGVKIKEKEFTITTSAFVCSDPGVIRSAQYGKQSIQNQKSPDGQTLISVSLQWQTPSSGCLNPPDPLIYSILVYDTEVVGQSARLINNFQSSRVTIPDLLPFRNYSVTIRATNKQNLNSSATIPLETIQTTPDDPPGGVTLYAYNATCVSLKWRSPPEKPNGIITQYYVDCGISATKERIKYQYFTGGNQTYSAIMCKFPSGTRVYCDVNAITREGDGVHVRVSTATKFRISVPKSEEEVVRGESGYFEVPFPVIDTDGVKGNIRNYSVIVSSSSTSNRKKRLTNVCKVDIDTERAGPPTFDPLLTYEEAMDCKLNYYLAAKLDKEVQPGYRFPVGDGNVYGGIMNVELKEGARYSVYYGVDVSLPGETAVVVQVLENSVSSFTVARGTTEATPPRTTRRKPLGNDTVTAIAVVISVVCVIIAATVVTVLLIRKRRQIKKNSSAPVRYASADNDYREPEAPSVSIRPIGTMTQSTEINGGSKKHKNKKYRNVKGDYENCPALPSPTREESEAIPVDKLKWYIDTNQALILQQYEKLKDVPVGETTAACLQENKSKCRYKDLYPVDSHRVLLKRLPSHGTDFINASHMSGYDRDNKFIAAQGPTSVTIQDFWLMIWQQDINSIVMATRTFETNKMKCVQYWPEAAKGEQTIGDFAIINMGVEQWPDYAITQLKVTKGTEEKWMTHYQFLSWPDHDVPDTSQPFLTFYRKFASQAAVKSGPILVHCSAGVGRSGAIIALDYLLEEAKAESKVDFYKCVLKMRKRRPNMIQTQEQYVFVHRVLYDALSTEGFLTQTDMFPSKKDDRLALPKEFQYIQETLSTVATITDSGKLAENLPLNRYKDILPDDKYRVYLNSRDGQAYINAIRVNGYRKVDQFYATQMPLEKTVKDFWQLVHERSCKVIIQLGDSTDKVKFYPQKSGTGYSYGSGTHTVTTKSQSEKGALQVYQLEHAIEKKNIMKEPRVYAETSEILLIKLPQNLCSKPHMQPTHVISMVEQIVRVIEKTGDINVLVMSSDGAGLCGMFICAFNCLESIRLTQEVEVYGQVLMAKHRRRQFISTYDEYKHIYQILGAYVDQFSQYQNVSCM